jgi:uncharacterized protein YrrD
MYLNKIMCKKNMEVFVKETIGLLAELNELNEIDHQDQILEVKKKLIILNNIIAAINEYIDLL